MLTAAEVDEYEAKGFIALRGFFHEPDLAGVEQALLHHAGVAPLADDERYEILYPALASVGPARLTAHPRLLAAIASALGADPVLSAFTAYIRTAGHAYRKDYNLHCDAHMWRPVSSSANWLFAIVPLSDFSESAGPLLVSAGSHRLSTWESWPLGVRVLRRPAVKEIAEPSDVRLRRGDLLLMNGRTWHAAPGANRSGHPRIGFFHKYAAANAPPGCGPFLIPSSWHGRFDRSIQELLPHHASAPPQHVRAILIAGDGIVVHRDESGGWRLPGGTAAPETLFPRWDGGANLIAAAERYAARCVAGEIPWMTWAGDTADQDSRVYVHAFRSEPRLRDDSAIVPAGNLRADDASVLHAFLGKDDVRAGGMTQHRWHTIGRAVSDGSYAWASAT